MAGLLEKVLHKSKSRSPQELVLKTDNSMKKLSLGATDHQVEDVARNLALMKVCSGQVARSQCMACIMFYVICLDPPITVFMHESVLHSGLKNQPGVQHVKVV